MDEGSAGRVWSTRLFVGLMTAAGVFLCSDVVLINNGNSPSLRAVSATLYKGPNRNAVRKDISGNRPSYVPGGVPAAEGGPDVATDADTDADNQFNGVELPFVAGIADRPAMPDGAPIGVGVGGDTGRTDHGIPNSCVTIIQISNGIDWDGINHTSFVHLAISAPAKAAHYLGMIEMYMYARRHGHGYRVINFEGKAVKFGSGRPDRHPAWSRIPLLWALYTGAKGVEEVLQPASVCPQEDQWLLYTDTDIAIHATGFSVGEIMAGLRAKSKKGLPCLSAYKNGTFAPGPDLTARLGERNLTDTSWCHDHRDRLGRALAPGVDPRTPVAVAGFNDLKSERGPFYDDCVLLDSEGSCPDSVRGNICSGIMLWRVPTPGFKGEQGGGSVAADALRAGKAMVDVWRTARLAPAAGTDHDPEDFLAMTWWDISTKRVIPVFDERVPRWRCKAVQCDYAGDQTVFSRAVLFGLPHRPYDAKNPANDGIGRFLPNIAVLPCKFCFKHHGYEDREPFSHLSGWWNKEHHLLGWLLKLSYELHGLDLIFRHTALVASKPKKENRITVYGRGALGNDRAARPIIRHTDPAKQAAANARLERCSKIAAGETEPTELTPAVLAGCADPEFEKRSVAKLDAVIAELRERRTVQLRLNPGFNGIDDPADMGRQPPDAPPGSGVDWYQIFHDDTTSNLPPSS